MMTEIYKDIPTYEGIYQASNLGNIKSLSRTVNNGRGGFTLIRERVLKLSVDSTGYNTVVLSVNGKKKTIKVHQLVAVTFLNHTPNGSKLVVDRINNNRLDNKLSNLQIITQRQNINKDRIGVTSDYTGVDSFRNKWRARIRVEGKQKHLGIFYTEQDAYNAYKKELNRINK